MENKSKKRKPPPDSDIQDPKLANILSKNTIINTFNYNDGVLKIKNIQETIYVFYYSIPEQLSLPKDSQLSLKHYLIVKPYLDDKHQDKFLIDFPIDTCSIKRYTYQTMGYCAFHSILNIFLRSEGCYHLLQRLRIFDVNAEFLSYLLNGKKYTSSFHIIDLLEKLQDKGFFICSKFGNNLGYDPIIFALIFVNAFNIKINGDRWMEEKVKSFKLTNKCDNLNISADLMIINIKSYNPNNIPEGFVIDAAILDNNEHAIAGITCLGKRYVVDSNHLNELIEHDWMTPIPERLDFNLYILFLVRIDNIYKKYKEEGGYRYRRILKRGE